MDGMGVKNKQRCGLPSIEDHVEDRGSFFRDHLHNAEEEQGDGVTSFFVRKSVYHAFFGRSLLPVLSQPEAQPQGDFSHIEGDTEILQDETEQTEDARMRQEEARRDRGRLQRLEHKQLQQADFEKERHEREKRQREDIEELERREHHTLEDEREFEDQQGFQQADLLEPEAPDEEEIVDNTKVHIHWKLHERGSWKDVLVLPVDPLDPSPIERMAKGYVRDNLRLFDTNLRMMTPRDCYPAVVTDGTHTILLIRESEPDIDNDLLLSAMKVRIEALSNRRGAPKRIATEDISQSRHVRKKHRGTASKHELSMAIA